MKATNLVAAICRPKEAIEVPIRVTRTVAEYRPNSAGDRSRSKRARKTVLRELLTMFWMVSDLIPETMFFVFAEVTVTVCADKEFAKKRPKQRRYMLFCDCQCLGTQLLASSEQVP